MNDKTLIGKWMKEYLKTVEHPMYKEHCGKFYKYIETQEKLDRPNEITPVDIDNCVGYYCEKGKLNTENTLAAHLEVLKSFYDYLHINGIFRDIFNSIPNYESFKLELKKKYSLSDSQEREFLQLSVVKDLLHYLDNELKPDELDGVVLKLFTKITLSAPAKKSVITGIKVNNFSEDFRVLNINGVDIRLTNSLRKDIISGIRNSDCEYEENSNIFDVVYGKKIAQSKFNEALLKYLNRIDFDVPESKTTYSVEKIMNTAIVQMIYSNVNPVLIAKINATKLGTIGDKVEKYGIEVKNQDQLINNAISSLDYYNYI